MLADGRNAHTSVGRLFTSCDRRDGRTWTDGTDMESMERSESDRIGKVLRFEQVRFGIGTRDGRTWTNGTDGRDGTDGHGQYEAV